MDNSCFETRSVTGKSHWFHEIRRNSQFRVRSFRNRDRDRSGFAVNCHTIFISMRIAVSQAYLQIGSSNNIEAEMNIDESSRRWESLERGSNICRPATIGQRGIRWQESRLATISRGPCKSTDGQTDRRPVERRFSPYPATGFPPEDTPV